MNDAKNGLRASIEIGNVKGKPKDHFDGVIENIKTKKKLATISGSYCGYVDFDG